MSKWLNVGEARMLEPENEWHLVLLDITDLIENFAKQYHGGNGFTLSDPKEYAARAISTVRNKIEREQESQDAN
jgi:hypothetical protein